MIRMLWYDENREEAGSQLLRWALRAFAGEGRVYAFFHYFGMSCYARHGKLFEGFGYIDGLLRQFGFSVEHENVYYSASLADNPETDIRIVWGEETAGGQRTAHFFDGEQCVGECEVHFVSEEIAYLRWIYVSSPLQNRGIGSRCIRSLRNALAEEGFSRLDTDTAVGNLRARHFYEKNGFFREGTTRSYYRDFPE